MIDQNGSPKNGPGDCGRYIGYKLLPAKIIREEMPLCLPAYKARLVALLASVRCTEPAGAVAPEASDMDLEDTGFVMRPAQTPQQLDA